MLLPKNSHLAQVLLGLKDVNASSLHLSWLQSLSGVVRRKSNCQGNVSVPSQFEREKLYILVR